MTGLSSDFYCLDQELTAMSTGAREVFRKRVLALLQKHSRRQGHMAELSGLHAATVSRWKKKQLPNPRLSEMEDLAQTFGVSIADLLLDEAGDPVPAPALTAETADRLAAEAGERTALAVRQTLDGLTRRR